VGVDGALPGIFMLAHPAVGDAYRHTYHPGQAEDLAQLERVGATHTIGLGNYRDVVVTQEWTPLEREIIEKKHYAPGVGKVYEIQTAGGEGGTRADRVHAGPLIDAVIGHPGRLLAGHAVELVRRHLATEDVTPWPAG